MKVRLNGNYELFVGFITHICVIDTVSDLLRLYLVSHHMYTGIHYNLPQPSTRQMGINDYEADGDDNNKDNYNLSSHV